MTPERSAQALELLGTLSKQRLLLSSAVAECKWAQGLPLGDEERERDFMAQILAQAQELGLKAEPVRVFFAAQLDASRRVQAELFASWQAAGLPQGRTPSGEAYDLAELRRELDRVSSALLRVFT